MSEAKSAGVNNSKSWNQKGIVNLDREPATGGKSFHMYITFSKAKQIYGHFIEVAGERDPEKFLLSKR